MSGKTKQRGVRVVVWKAKARMKDDVSTTRVVEFEGTGTYEECFGNSGANFKAAMAAADGQPASGKDSKRTVEELIRVSYELYLSKAK